MDQCSGRERAQQAHARAEANLCGVADEQTLRQGGPHRGPGQAAHELAHGQSVVLLPSAVWQQRRWFRAQSAQLLLLVMFDLHFLCE